MTLSLYSGHLFADIHLAHSTSPSPSGGEILSLKFFLEAGAQWGRDKFTDTAEQRADVFLVWAQLS